MAARFLCGWGPLCGGAGCLSLRAFFDQLHRAHRAIARLIRHLFIVAASAGRAYILFFRRVLMRVDCSGRRYGKGRAKQDRDDYQRCRQAGSTLHNNLLVAESVVIIFQTESTRFDIQRLLFCRQMQNLAAKALLIAANRAARGHYVA